MESIKRKIFKRFLYKRGYRIHSIGCIVLFESLIETFLRKKELFSTQIGANEGKVLIQSMSL